MKIIIEKSIELIPNKLYSFDISENELSIFGLSQISEGSTVISTNKIEFNNTTKRLIVDIDNVSIKSKSSSKTIILLVEDAITFENSSSSNKKSFDKTTDTDFINELTFELKELGIELIKRIRNEVLPNGGLKKLSKGSYIETTDNYFTLKVQPRAKNICLTVFGNEISFKKYDDIELKNDRHPYSIFRISNITQINSTIEILKQSIINKDK